MNRGPSGLLLWGGLWLLMIVSLSTFLGGKISNDGLTWGQMSYNVCIRWGLTLLKHYRTTAVLCPPPPLQKKKKPTENPPNNRKTKQKNKQTIKTIKNNFKTMPAESRIVWYFIKNLILFNAVEELYKKQ